MNCLENGPPPIEKGYGLVSIKSVSVSVSLSLSLSVTTRDLNIALRTKY